MTSFHIRVATGEDILLLHQLIERSVRVLQANDYSPAQIEGALGTVLGVDSQLVADRTYFDAITDEENGASMPMIRMAKSISAKDFQ